MCFREIFKENLALSAAFAIVGVKIFTIITILNHAIELEFAHFHATWSYHTIWDWSSDFSNDYGIADIYTSVCCVD